MVASLYDGVREGGEFGWPKSNSDALCRLITECTEVGRKQRLLTKVRSKEQMATNSPERHVPKPQSSVIRWLLDSDPSIRWQVMRDLIGAPAPSRGRRAVGRRGVEPWVELHDARPDDAAGDGFSIPRVRRHGARWGSSVTA